MEDLRIYQKSLDLVVEIYSLIKANPKLAKDFSLNDQLKRASISVVSNIAEGYLRTKRQFKNYLNIAAGSANEVIALLQIVSRVYQIKTLTLQNSYKLLAKQIISFSKRLMS